METLLPANFFIYSIIISAFLLFIYKLFKFEILSYISKYPWSKQFITNEYKRVLFARERRKIRKLNDYIEYAKLLHKSERRKYYVIKLMPGKYWVGTGTEWNEFAKNKKYLKRIWPPRDAVFQTH